MLRTHTVTRSLLAMLAALALFATGCGGSTADTTAVAATDEPATAPAAATQAASDETANAAPASTLVANTVTGGQIDFGSLAGQDVVLWYWAPW